MKPNITQPNKPTDKGEKIRDRKAIIIIVKPENMKVK